MLKVVTGGINSFYTLNNTLHFYCNLFWKTYSLFQHLVKPIKVEHRMVEYGIMKHQMQNGITRNTKFETPIYETTIGLGHQ